MSRARVEGCGFRFSIVVELLGLSVEGLVRRVYLHLPCSSFRGWQGVAAHFL